MSIYELCENIQMFLVYDIYQYYVCVPDDVLNYSFLISDCVMFVIILFVSSTVIFSIISTLTLKILILFQNYNLFFTKMC